MERTSPPKMFFGGSPAIPRLELSCLQPRSADTCGRIRGGTCWPVHFYGDLVPVPALSVSRLRVSFSLSLCRCLPALALLACFSLTLQLRVCERTPGGSLPRLPGAGHSPCCSQLPQAILQCFDLRTQEAERRSFVEHGPQDRFEALCLIFASCW